MEKQGSRPLINGVQCLKGLTMWKPSNGKLACHFPLADLVGLRLSRLPLRRPERRVRLCVVQDAPW